MDDRELRDLEAAMWQPETRGDRRWMEAHLAPDFVEFGRSGRRYSREEILDLDAADLSGIGPLRGLAVRALGDQYALVTYQSESGGHRSNRSSIWRRVENGWLMEFHQGTPAPDEAN